MTSPSCIVRVLLGFSSPFARQGLEVTVCLSLSPVKDPMFVLTRKRCDGHVFVSLMSVTKSTQQEVVPILHKTSGPQAMGSNRNRQGAAEMALS